MRRILIISGHVGSVAECIIQKTDNTVLVVNNVEAKNIINSEFEPEPIILTNHLDFQPEIKIKDFPRSKYFDKPKNNYKK